MLQIHSWVYAYVIHLPNTELVQIVTSVFSCRDRACQKPSATCLLKYYPVSACSIRSTQRAHAGVHGYQLIIVLLIAFIVVDIGPTNRTGDGSRYRARESYLCAKYFRQMFPPFMANWASFWRGPMKKLRQTELGAARVRSLPGFFFNFKIHVCEVCDVMWCDDPVLTCARKLAVKPT